MTRPRIVVGLVVAIAVATMFSTGGPIRPFSYCLTCNFRWLADWVANVALFLPLGCAMNWKRRHFVRTALRVAGFSMVVEMVQTTIPGRDPSLGDVIANSLGGALGAFIGSRPSAWLTPDPRLADRLLALTIILVAVIVGETEWLLAPSSSITRGSQLTNAVAELFRGQATMTLGAVSNPSAAEQTFLSIGPAPFQVLYLGRVATDAVFRYRSRGRDLGLDEPDYPVIGFFDDTGKADTIRISVSRQGPGWCISRTGRRKCGIGPTIGRGWAVLRYPYSVGRRWQRTFDALWAALLFVPLGFWSRRRTIPIAVIAAVVILGPFARFAPLVPTPASEWLGALSGFVVGLTVGFWLRGRHERVQEMTSAPA